MAWDIAALRWEKPRLLEGDCIAHLRALPDGCVDAIVTDPPYGYLDHRLDAPFDEGAWVEQVARVLKPDGIIAMFGRGATLYRLCGLLSQAGLAFKEEVV